MCSCAHLHAAYGVLFNDSFRTTFSIKLEVFVTAALHGGLLDSMGQFVRHDMLTMCGIQIQSTVQMNVCDTEGQIIDSKQVAKDSYDQELDNYYDTANCILFDNGQIVIKKKSRQGNTSKERIETERYSINSNGKIVKI